MVKVAGAEAPAAVATPKDASPLGVASTSPDTLAAKTPSGAIGRASEALTGTAHQVKAQEPK
jgi:hypothetical protein